MRSQYDRASSVLLAGPTKEDLADFVKAYSTKSDVLTLRQTDDCRLYLRTRAPASPFVLDAQQFPVTVEPTRDGVRETDDHIFLHDRPSTATNIRSSCPEFCDVASKLRSALREGLSRMRESPRVRNDLVDLTKIVLHLS